jgi:predicted metalloprotease
MKWRNVRQSSNVEDRRGSAALPIGGGIGTLVLGLIIYFMGGDPTVVLNQPQSGSNSSITRQQNSGKPDEAKQFVAAVLGDTEDVWTEIFKRNGRRYREPKLVLFSGQVSSACGIAGTSVGPFYCPADEKLYIDLAFFRELSNRFGAPGDFAQAYVIAHEVGHHVQNQMGTMSKVQPLQSRATEKQANQLSVRLELQADFYAGVWAHYAEKRGILDPGDIEEALGAASAVGDDRLQSQARGYVVPDSFTHGSSQQRSEWFMRGFKSGDVTQGNTFNARIN